MSSLRAKLEQQRIDALEKKGQAPRVFMPEQSATDTGRNLASARLAAEDASLPVPRGTDLRSRLGQPRPAAPDPATIVTMDIGFQRAAEENTRASIQAAQERLAKESAERERQRVTAAAESERLRQAGLDFERETTRLAIEDATGKLTLAEYDAVERIVLSQYPAGISDPNIWRIAATEYRDNIRVRKAWMFAPYNVINESTDEQLAVMFETSVETIKNLRAEEL